MSYKILEIDPYLQPFENDINLRMDNLARKKQQLFGNGGLACRSCGYRNGSTGDVFDR